MNKARAATLGRCLQSDALTPDHSRLITRRPRHPHFLAVRPSITMTSTTTKPVSAQPTAEELNRGELDAVLARPRYEPSGR
jgi:hypothetical protein